MPSKKQATAPPRLKKFFAKIGSIGGSRSKRTITPEQQKKMQRARRAAMRLRRKAK